MLRKGFTLIELLIVITIIAILAGAAIPYVQDYVEDARLAKVRADLDEIKNALLRYELDTGKIWNATSTATLVGPYLTKAMVDPWGGPYQISATSSVVFSLGPNRASNYAEVVPLGAAGTLADDIAVDFRAPMALSKVYYIDANKDGLVNDGDQLKVRFTRELEDPTTLAAADFEININGVAGSTFTTITAVQGSDRREALITITDITGGVFTPGRDMLSVEPASANAVDRALVPYGPPNNISRPNGVLIAAL